jgi:hypothetical protein
MKYQLYYLPPEGGGWLLRANLQADNDHEAIAECNNMIRRTVPKPPPGTVFQLVVPLATRQIPVPDDTWSDQQDRGAILTETPGPVPPEPPRAHPPR